MFIETLEFTIPIDLCDLFSTLKKGPRSNLEFPASVNSYGTTQDASIQVALRSNKLTFKVDGVSSDASMISKSECKTLKLSIFDVDRTLMPQESYYQEETSHSVSMSFPAKRSRDFSAPVKSPPSKSSRTTYSESPRGSTPVQYHNQNNFRTSEQSHSRPSSDSRVNVKQEPEDPDLIEIEPDPEPDDIVPKKETPYMQIDYSSDVPHTQTSQAALDRLSHPQSSHSQSPGSSSSSFHQNVPHVPDYAEPSTSQVHHGDQSADDFLVFQEQDDNDCDNDNDADFDNEDFGSFPVMPKASVQDFNQSAGLETLGPFSAGFSFPYSLSVDNIVVKDTASKQKPAIHPCDICGKMFTEARYAERHKKATHEKVHHPCVCGKMYTYDSGLQRHQKVCPVYLTQVHQLNS
ncbi:zinc finger protein 202-like isoform X7 [Haliotis asinina]|uniref:zinc finger protein 202-like isoform X7 n=1 Tax=Haliotis asinina TaxID=109174 RepID=UPI0035322D9D